MSNVELCDAVEKLCNAAGVEFLFVTEGNSRWKVDKDEHIQRLANFHIAMMENGKLDKGVPIWYVDDESTEVERGVVESLYYKNGHVDSIGVDFPETRDFDEFAGYAIGNTLFLSEEEAKAKLFKI